VLFEMSAAFIILMRYDAGCGDLGEEALADGGVSIDPIFVSA